MKDWGFFFVLNFLLSLACIIPFSFEYSILASKALDFTMRNRLAWRSECVKAVWPNVYIEWPFHAGRLRSLKRVERRVFPKDLQE